MVEVVVDIGCQSTHVGVGTQAVCPPGPAAHCVNVAVDAQKLPDGEDVVSVGNGADGDVVDVNNVVGGGDCWLMVQSGVSRSSMDLFPGIWFSSGSHVMSCNCLPSTYTLTKAFTWPVLRSRCLGSYWISTVPEVGGVSSPAIGI